MNGFTDIHQHVLYGVDDGAGDWDTMCEMLKASAADQVKQLVATPHISPGLQEPDYDRIMARYREACTFIQEQQLNIRLILGAENLYSPLMINAAQNKTLWTMGSTEYVLVEFLPTAPLDELKDAAEMLNSFGYHPIYAHVERYDCLTGSITQAKRLKQQYRLSYQMNAQTIAFRSSGLKGMPVRRMLKHELIDYIGSDAHNLTTRRTRMSEAYNALRKLIGDQKAEEICFRKLL